MQLRNKIPVTLLKCEIHEDLTCDFFMVHLEVFSFYMSFASASNQWSTDKVIWNFEAVCVLTDWHVHTHAYIIFIFILYMLVNTFSGKFSNCLM